MGSFVWVKSRDGTGWTRKLKESTSKIKSKGRRNYRRRYGGNPKLGGTR